eukprot:gb/GECG01002099.1/.p1 GENE.gb/GECG01002099.1/~~gb/GECG01002099.1/.p1  ORF type:complete len:110 (+),score=11.02 gb/GECG01002099.1/:1-330(+)
MRRGRSNEGRNAGQKQRQILLNMLMPYEKEGTSDSSKPSHNLANTLMLRKLRELQAKRNPNEHAVTLRQRRNARDTRTASGNSQEHTLAIATGKNHTGSLLGLRLQLCR